MRLEVTDGFVGEDVGGRGVDQRDSEGDRGEDVPRRLGPRAGGWADQPRDRRSDDLPQMQQEIAAAGGTPGALEPSAGGTDATPGTTAAAEQTGSVTVRVYSCPAEMGQAAGQGQLTRPSSWPGARLDAPEMAPTLRTLPDGEPMAATATEPGVYGWEELAFGDYAVGGSGEMPADLGGLLVTDANGAPLQNPALRLDAMSPHVEYHYYFLAEATPAA